MYFLSIMFLYICSSGLTKRLCEVAKPDIKWITEVLLLSYEILSEVAEDVVIVIVNLDRKM